MNIQIFGTKKCSDTRKADRQVITDLLDTLRENLDHCNGVVI